VRNQRERVFLSAKFVRGNFYLKISPQETFYPQVFFGTKIFLLYENCSRRRFLFFISIKRYNIEQVLKHTSYFNGVLLLRDPNKYCISDLEEEIKE